MPQFTIIHIIHAAKATHELVMFLSNSLLFEDLFIYKANSIVAMDYHIWHIFICLSDIFEAFQFCLEFSINLFAIHISIFLFVLDFR